MIKSFGAKIGLLALLVCSSLDATVTEAKRNEPLKYFGSMDSSKSTNNQKNIFKYSSPVLTILADTMFSGLSFSKQVSYVLKFNRGISLRPTVGVQLEVSKHAKLIEKNSGSFGQSYGTKVTRNGEAIGGLGISKQWKIDDLESNITFIYEYGKKSGNGKAKTKGFDALFPNVQSNTTAKNAQYLNLNGSLLSPKDHWKVLPGVVGVYQKRQKSYTFTVKAEYRF